MKLVDSRIEDYCISISSRPSSLCEELANYTRQNVSQSQMLIGPLEASVLGFLIRIGGYRRILEIGTYTGYSALSMAENLPEGGELITLDVNEDTTKIAQSFWDRSPHGSKIRSVLGRASESFSKISGPFDLVFIDADKESYSYYFEKSLEYLSPNGTIVVDNTLWSGRVLEEPAEGSTRAIQMLNTSVGRRASSDLFVSLLPVRDGMLLIRRR